MTHAHRFLIPEPDGRADVPASCLDCGEVRVHRQSHHWLRTTNYGNRVKTIVNGKPTNAHPFRRGYSAKRLEREAKGKT